MSTRRDFPGEFSTTDLGRGAWRLTRSEPATIDLFLRGVEPGAADALRSATVSAISIRWQDDGVVLDLNSGARPRSVAAQSAIVHEPLPRLYDALSLASFDDKAARFWRRVFRLVRVPGGRYLLKILARRSRAAG